VLEGAILHHEHDDMFDVSEPDGTSGTSKCQKEYNVLRHCFQSTEELDKILSSVERARGDRVSLAREISFNLYALKQTDTHIES
jgi:hypothetical protein